MLEDNIRPSGYVQCQDSTTYINNETIPNINNRNETNNSVIGNPGHNNSGIRNQQAERNQRNNNKVSRQHFPSGSANQFNNSHNMQINKNVQENPRQWVPGTNLQSSIPNLDTFGQSNNPIKLSNDMNEDRLDPKLLSAFKENPYTKSLNSY